MDRDRIKFHLHVESHPLDIDTLVPIALITNELISNSLKHAFDKDQNGEIFLDFRIQEKEIHLKQSDTGKGFQDLEELKNSDSFGFQLIDILSQKLQAKTEFDGKNGFQFTLQCPIMK